MDTKWTLGHFPDSGSITQCRELQITVLQSQSQSPSTLTCFWLSFKVTAKKTSFLSMFILPWHLPLLAIIWITFFFPFMFSVLIHLIVPGSYILIFNCDFSTLAQFMNTVLLVNLLVLTIVLPHTVSSAGCYCTAFLILLMVGRAFFWNNGRKGWDQWWFN